MSETEKRGVYGQRFMYGELPQTSIDPSTPPVNMMKIIKSTIDQRKLVQTKDEIILTPETVVNLRKLIKTKGEIVITPEIVANLASITDNRACTSIHPNSFSNGFLSPADHQVRKYIDNCLNTNNSTVEMVSKIDKLEKDTIEVKELLEELIKDAEKFKKNSKETEELKKNINSHSEKVANIASRYVRDEKLGTTIEARKRKGILPFFLSNQK